MRHDEMKKEKREREDNNNIVLINASHLHTTLTVQTEQTVNGYIMS